MCGIAGMSLHPKSKINARRLAHELLSGIEFRGGHAAGYAAFTRKGGLNVYKDHVPGSQLPLAGLPRNSRNVILHTRYATQGDISDNRNNHPVLSGSRELALVHNGVITNDWEFRGDDRYDVIGEVDSAVIPNIIEYDGIEGLKSMEGYAAIAWLDRSQPDMHFIARLDTSPVHYTWTEDGSFVWASTAEILEVALATVGIRYGHVFELQEKRMMVLRGSVIESVAFAEMSEDWYSARKFLNATSGGRGGSEDNEACTTGEKPGAGETGSTFWYDDDADPMAFAGFGPETNYDPETGEVYNDASAATEGFYITMEDGNTQFYPNLDELEAELDWLSNLSLYDGAPLPDVEHKLKWTNFIMDIGEIRGSAPDSWLDDMSGIDAHESPAVRNLEYIRDGLSRVLVAMGS